MLSCKSHGLVVLLVCLLVISFVAAGSNSKEAIFLSANKLHFQGRFLLKEVASPDGNVTIAPSGGSKQIQDFRRETSQAAVRRQNHPVGSRVERPVCNPRLPPGRNCRPGAAPSPREGRVVAPILGHPPSPPGNRRGHPVRHPRLPPGTASPPGKNRAPRLRPYSRPPRSTRPPGSRKGPPVAPVLPVRRHPGGPPGNRRVPPVRHASLPPASNKGHHGAP